jgi:glycosyltransferase involved in cell wall biosynthesis
MSLNLSVITPSYNQGRFIERTICSVLNQNFPVEYAVFDGGSKDQTVDILKKFENQLHWVSEKDRGQGHAVNKGIHATQGEIIGWINSDDIYYPGVFQAVMSYFEEHPEIDLVYGNANHIGLEDEVLEPYPTKDWDPKQLLNACYICQPAAFFRRRVVDRFGELDESLSYNMDYEYWLRLARGGIQAARLPILAAGSRMYRENKTLRSRTANHNEINNIFIKMMGVVPERWVFNYAHAVLDDRGLPRTARFRFSVAVSVISIWASFHWNHRVTRSLLTTCRHWISASLRNR